MIKSNQTRHLALFFFNNVYTIRQTGGNAFFAVKTTTAPSLPNWVGSNTANTAPGDGSGFIFEKDYINPKCPHAVSNWLVYFNGETQDDPTFKFECAVGTGIFVLTRFIFLAIEKY